MDIRGYLADPQILTYSRGKGFGMRRGKKRVKPPPGSKRMENFLNNFLRNNKGGKTLKAGELLKNPLNKKKRRERNQNDAKNFLDLVCRDICDNPENADVCFKRMTEVTIEFSILLP